MDVKTEIFTKEEEFQKRLKEKAEKSYQSHHPYDLSELKNKLRKKV